MASNICNRRPKHISDKLNLTICAIATPVHYFVRPLGALHNPYPSSCSILCNHPGPRDVKSIVQQVKISQHNNEKCIKNNINSQQNTEISTIEKNTEDQIPDEFYQRFSSSDSRPHTPPQSSVQSIRTRINGFQLIQTRRCLTPEPTRNETGERKQIVLDLRRSHSQETIFWNASSDLSSHIQDVKTKSEIPKTVIKSIDECVRNVRLCELEARKRSAERKQQQLKEQETNSLHQSIVCINERNDIDDEIDGMKRRGKKKKKKKIQNRNAFHMSNEPETLIATIEPDSPNASARPSLVSNDMVTSAINDLTNIDKYKQNGMIKNSFINEDALKILRRGLNIDIVESAFERFINRALREALRTIPSDQIDEKNIVMNEYVESIGIKNIDNEKWLTMPRKYTRSSVRFSLPVNSNDLAILTTFQYLSKHVWISDQRKQLYRFVFNKYKNSANLLENDTNTDDGDDIDDDYITTNNNNNNKKKNQIEQNDASRELTSAAVSGWCECRMNLSDLDSALIDVIGYKCKNSERFSDTQHIRQVLDLDYVEQNFLTFRNWCGITAFTERYLNIVPSEIDQCDEVEIADFETLERRIGNNFINEKLKLILTFIKYNDHSLLSNKLH